MSDELEQVMTVAVQRRSPVVAFATAVGSILMLYVLLVLVGGRSWNHYG